jgi:hypothetical protein
MNKLTKTRALGAALSAAVVATAGALSATPAWAGPFVSLAGSTFEIDADANLKLDGDNPALTLDWATVTEVRKQDQPTGSGRPLRQHAKEHRRADRGRRDSPTTERPVPSVATRRARPPTDSANHSGPAGPQRTTNMDFEFNQAAWGRHPDGVTPLRTAGDLLITYDLSRAAPTRRSPCGHGRVRCGARRPTDQ